MEEVLAFVRDRLDRASLQAICAAVIGLGLVAVGLESLRRRFFDMGVDPGSPMSSSRFVFRGPGAVSWGVMCVTLGLGMIAVAAVVLLGLVDAAERLVAERPGIVIAPLGLVFLGAAGGWLWGEEQMNSSFLMVLATLPQRLGALVTVLFSLAVLGVGLFELVAPAAFDQIVAMLTPPPAPVIPAR